MEPVSLAEPYSEKGKRARKNKRVCRDASFGEFFVFVILSLIGLSADLSLPSVIPVCKKQRALNYAAV